MSGDKKRKNEDETQPSKKEKKEEVKESEPVVDQFLIDNQITISGKNVPKYIKKFDELADTVSSKILKKLEKMKFTEPTIIQKFALPIALAGRDSNVQI
jgi:superfamily II DNA/RNA helicase